MLRCRINGYRRNTRTHKGATLSRFLHALVYTIPANTVGPDARVARGAGRRNGQGILVDSQSARRTARPAQLGGVVHAVLALGLALLAACGGSDVRPDSQAQAVPAEGQKRALAVVPSTPVPADAHLKGMWGPQYPWPLIPIHSVLMPDGRVLTFGSKPDGRSTGFFGVDLWDSEVQPDQGHLFIANGTGNDLFCSTQLLLPPAAGVAPNLLVAGGDAWTGTQSSYIGIKGSTLFDGNARTLVAGNPMGQPRWYASAITLVNGETYIQGGYGGAAQPEVRQLDGSFRALSTANTGFLVWSYPRNYVVPDGRVFGYDFQGRMYFVDTAGTGRVAARTILPLQYFGEGSSAMFRPGRILQVGGNTSATAVIDVTGAEPVFTPTQSVSTVRKLMNTTLLADGQVLVTGGSPVWNEVYGANKAAEIWNPTSGQWTVGAAQLRPRLYHSTALLLPDASVLVGGGGAPAPIGEDPAGDRNVEIYYPPYLFTAAGARAVRPVIATAPDALEIGKVFGLQVSGNGVSRVTLVKTGSATHGWNFDQRFLDLPFTRSATPNGSALTVNAPSRTGEATPGYYMLFVFDAAGVPSQARILRLGIAGPTNTAVAPTISNPGPQAGTLGVAQSLRLVAADPNGNALVYSATGLPPGLNLDAASGQIVGAPTAPGDHHVVVSASDGTYTASASLIWRVAPQSALTLTLVPTPGASLAGSSASFAAGAVGTGVQYSWTFGDGSPDTAWSAQPTVNKIYTRPGSYTVTVRIRDASGALISRTFLQTVYLGHGNKTPSATSSVVLEVPLYGPPRVWVVNPDQDSITGFDTLTHNRLGEVAVGAGPRAIAVATNERLWVTNKDSASISVVNPITRQLVRSIALPRASQPHGLAISPSAPQAFVVLEATGELLRFDTNSYTETGRLALGPNVRHVSVAGNGRSVFVTRFITPPMPGEGTPLVSLPANRGGEVIEVDAATLARVRTIVLAPSTRPDAENQGSGIPNYLGAAAVSPDGTQAYVPSKQDNIGRGLQRNGAPLDFQNTVRAISSRLVLSGVLAGTEDLARRIDHDNASVASAALFDVRGVLLFVALETSREVAVLDAHSGAQLMRFDVGRAPQGLALSADGYTLYVSNTMDRTVGVHDLRPLLLQGLASVPTLATLSAVASERLAPAVLRGKQLFYDARDGRLARDGYLSCAACHADGRHDGRTWDFTHLGEGLRNTISLRGRAGGQGRLHWSGNFDELQDFEGQIRRLAGGLGLMTDAQFNTGTRSQPLGDAKAGVSPDLDALAAYVASLTSFDPAPGRQADGSLTAAALAGRTVFQAQCASCHSGADFTDSATGALHNIGTLRASSGMRSGATITGLDTPTLRDAWATAPYLHDGSAATVEDAVLAHRTLTLSPADLASVAAFVRQIGREEGTVTPPPPPPPPPSISSSAIFGPLVGTAFTDPVAIGQVVTGVTGILNNRIVSLRARATPAHLPAHGGTVGSSGTLTFASGEHLVRIFGRTDAVGVVTLGFGTSTGRVFGPYGQNPLQAGTTPFDFTVPAGQRVLGFIGRSGTTLTAIGVLYGP
jgi:mono/diheme cytochrome c family protein